VLGECKITGLLSQQSFGGMTIAVLGAGFESRQGTPTLNTERAVRAGYSPKSVKNADLRLLLVSFFVHLWCADTLRGHRLNDFWDGSVELV
jgi:hypothetical protein